MSNALTDLVNLASEEKIKLGIEFTADEIYGQVDLWNRNYNIFKQEKEEIKSFIDNYLKEDPRNIILAGAGTSEFIGYCIEGPIRKALNIPTNVFSTTRIVTSPEQIIIKDFNTLMVSFARSGNSPESFGAVKIANEVSSKLQHLVITCNKNGKLYKDLSKYKNAYCLALDQKTNDQGLAMTASFSNMVLSGLMLSHINDFDEFENNIDKIAEAGKNILETVPDIISAMSSLDFNRAVFLGDSGNYGTAIESHLKLQELTSGKIMCSYDSFPGLRHGPEAVIDSKTIVTAFLSLDAYTRHYEIDLLKELKNKQIGKAVLLVSDKIDDKERKLGDYFIEFDPEKRINLYPKYTPPIYVIVGQLIGLFKSLDLGLKPDNPSEKGIINRVVKGVKIYGYKEYLDKKRFSVIAER